MKFDESNRWLLLVVIALLIVSLAVTAMITRGTGVASLGKYGDSGTYLNNVKLEEGDYIMLTPSDAHNSIIIGLISAVHIFSESIYDPDGIQPTEDAIPLLAVESDWAPYGIELISVGIKTDVNSTYSVDFEEWTSPLDGSPSTIETVATSGSCEAEDDGTLTDSDIAVGSIIYIDLPDTNINMLQVWGTYYIKAED